MNKRHYWTLEELQGYAKKKDGKCLSSEYLGSGKKHQWQCNKCGYIWETTWGNMNNKQTWCPKCTDRIPKTIEDCNKLAKSRGGKCLSTKYKNAHTKLKWQCSEGHIFMQDWHHANNAGKWCRKCAEMKSGDTQKCTIEDCQELASKYNGKCLSTKYKNSHTKLKWQCEKGHKFYRERGRIVAENRWCPHCINKSEQKCREIFEEVFGVEFHKKRPKWLISEAGGRMEFDGYNEELGVAFEYQGIQHYEAVDYFGGKCQLAQIQHRDALKVKICKENGVTLYVIPYWEKDVRNII